MKHVKSFETNESEDTIYGKHFKYIKHVFWYGIYYKNSTERIGLFVYDFTTKSYQLELDDWKITSDQLQELAEFSKDPELFKNTQKYNL